MQNALDKGQLEALLRAVKMPPKPSHESSEAVESFQFQANVGSDPEQEKALKEVQANLAEGISQSLGAYLRANFEAQSAAIKNVTFREALEAIPERAYLLGLEFQEAPTAIQIDSSLVFPLLDILLGGNGQSASLERDLTEIEENVLSGVGKILAQTLASAWSAPGVRCELIGSQSAIQLQSLFPPNEKMVEFVFETKLAEASGSIRVLIPANTTNSLLRKLTSDLKPIRANTQPSTKRVGEKLLQCSFPATLAVTSSSIPIEMILSMQAGQICNLGIPLNQPALLRIANRDTFEAVPVRNGQKRAAHLGQQLPSSDTRNKE